MATTHKPFRELLKPGSNFEFLGRTRLWVSISVLLIIGSMVMLFVNKSVRGDYLNWSTDFKGGTEMIFGFRDKNTGEHIEVSAGDARTTLEAAKIGEIEVSDLRWDEERNGQIVTVRGMLVRTPSFGVLDSAQQNKIVEEFRTRFADREILNARWSGDRIFVRSKKPLVEEEARAFLAQQGIEMKPWGELASAFITPDEGTGEYEAQLPIFGLERQFAKVLESKLDVTVDLVQSYAVGARAGKELRNDGIKSLFYAMGLILLYLAFRFDIRYAPGAVIALLHDAFLVVGAFAVTWMDFSLTTVAAILTVIGYSVNDTVIIFDRIRENVERLKDKKLERIVNISLNEVLSRSILTSSTVFAVTLAMNILGTGLVANFAFAMNVGVVVGTYSSIFIAAPIFLYLDRKYYSGRADASARTKKARA